MPAALVSVINNVAKVIRAIPGIKNVQEYPPEQMNYDLYAVIYPNSGAIEGGPTGVKQSLDNIYIDVLKNRTDLARDMTALVPFIDLVSIALMEEISFDSDANPGQQFNQTIETFERVTYSLIQTDYGGTPVIGYQFAMENVKIQVNL